ncbi:uncharacterized protein [Clytia hemisphaerica]|uniref:Winged helix Storkhead-box1 domain-containing protein n=1 Tax=Clytia hemisphaerica TaxID=252671 RepID=A0A7M5VHH3_9CNID
MHQKMGRPESSKTHSKNGRSTYRRSLLGSSTLAIFLQPTFLARNLSSSSSPKTPDEEKENKEVSAEKIFSLLKDANKIMVKGAKLFESLNELKLCGWINPYTLLLSGVSEDMKLVKRAWIKRHLKNPENYFIKDIGIIRDCVVEMIPQSPFMSLTTALFEAVADLNHQNIFPTKDILHEYLRKHYPEIKTPDTKIIHECLGRLIKNRRLYHNGRGYFILFNENVLNEVISLKSSLKPLTNDTTSLEPSIIGFKMMDSRTSSSGQTDGHTDLPTDLDHRSQGGDVYQNIQRHQSVDTLTEVTALADGVANISELYTPKLHRTSFGGKLFRKNNNKAEKGAIEKTHKNHAKMFSCSTATDSIILSNDLINTPSRVPIVQGTETMTIQNKDVLDSATMSDVTDVQSPSMSGRRRKVKRSKSFNGKNRREPRTSSNKEVSFALIGSPRDSDGSNNDEYPKRFQRSHSFGVGYHRDKYQRPSFSERPTIERAENIKLSTTSNNTCSSNENTFDHTFVTELDETYDDIEPSFVDDNIPVFEDGPELSHRPDMLPVVDTSTFETLENYKDLGSALSLPRINDKGINFNVVDLLSPTKEECLAEELKQAGEVDIDSLEKETRLLSPRSRKKHGTPYESQYITEAVDQSEEICQALEDSKRDKNSNYLSDRSSTTPTGSKSSKSTKGVKMRNRSKSSEDERKRNQKERNSLLFEEKRPSLKVMGMV